MKIEQALSLIKKPDSGSMKKAQNRFDTLAKPLKSLGLLEDSIIAIAGIQRSENIDISKKCIAVFCSDNGIVSRAVTQCGQEITAKVCEEISLDKTSICNIAQFAGADVIPVDVGIYREVEGKKIINKKIAYSTKDFTLGAAMTRQEAIKSIETGIDLAFYFKKLGYNFMAAGEMGIGNTTTAAAVCSVILETDPQYITGKGAGLSDEGLKRKIEVIKKGIEVNNPDKNDPIDVLSKLGGFDIGAMAGFYIGCAACKTAVVMDGVISCTAALIAVKISDEVKDYILPSHMSSEPLGRILLEKLNKKPLICAQMHLGEGTGAAASFLLYDLADNFYKKMYSFGDMDMQAYKPL